MTGVLGYRAATYTPVPLWRRWWPLAQQEFRSLFATRWGVGLFFLCTLPAIARLIMLLILFGVVQFGPAHLRNRLPRRGGGDLGDVGTIDPFRVEFYMDHVLQVMPGMVFVLLLTTLNAARTIARDRTTNALELYWTRGITPWTYLFAKWLGASMLVGTLTVGAPLVLWLTASLLAEDWSLMTSTAAPLAQALLGVAIATMVWNAVAVLLSAACKSPNAAMVLWSILLAGGGSFAFVLASVLRERSLQSCLSLWDAGATVARAIGGLPQRHVSVPGALTMLGVTLTLCWLLARRRTRITEAVG